MQPDDRATADATPGAADVASTETAELQNDLPVVSTDEPAYRRLTDAQKAKILRLADEGLTQIVIAQHLGISQDSVSRTIRTFGSTAQLARRRAEARSLAVVNALAEWAQTRDKVGVDSAKTILHVAGLTEKQQQTNVAVQVVVGAALPGTPQHSSEVVDAQVVAENDE